MGNTLYSSDFLSLSQENGWIVLDRGNSAGVLVRDPDKDVFLAVEQFRAGPKTRTTEIVCGKVDDPETPRQAAMREVTEETGPAIRYVRFCSESPILSYYPSPGVCSEKMFVYYMEASLDISRSGTVIKDGREETTVYFYTFNELLEKANDSATNMSLMWYASMSS